MNLVLRLTGAFVAVCVAALAYAWVAGWFTAQGPSGPDDLADLTHRVAPAQASPTLCMDGAGKPNLQGGTCAGRPPAP